MSMPTMVVRSALAGAILLAIACQPQPVAVNPEDPEITAALEATLKTAIEGAEAADAERALSVTTRDADFTFITGDTMLEGYDASLAAFKDTYHMLKSQTTKVIQSRVRVLAPDVAVVSAVSEGTYTDKAGFTSEPVGLGSTIIFVKRDGEWRVIHFHQSVAK